ncbi:hypothetical protein O3M35_009998 [Rhynocoris fuscipes]|uniref:Uncharacterized protein n=1 Tax=Rhynocoris fuscipes TaxID=488301 RepID=A0AAW1D527_9HEMI
MVREDRVSAKGFGQRERAEWNLQYLAIATSNIHMELLMIGLTRSWEPKLSVAIENFTLGALEMERRSELIEKLLFS